jgi:hypothetical protein
MELNKILVEYLQLGFDFYNPQTFNFEFNFANNDKNKDNDK